MGIIYTITINQFAVISNGWNLDLNDMAIFQCFHIFGSSPKTQRITTETGTWFWLSAKKIIEEIPMLGIGSDKQLKRRIAKLIDCGLLEKCAEDTTRDYYRFGQNYEKLFVKEEGGNNFRGVEKSSTGRTKMSGDVDKNVPNTRTKMSTEDNIIYNNNIIQEKDYTNTPYIPLKGESPQSPRADYRKLASDFCETIAEEDWRQIVSEFLAYKCDIKAPLKCQRSLTAFVNNLKRDSGNDVERARGFLEKAIAKGWQSYHPDAEKTLYEQKREAEMKEKEEKAAQQAAAWRAERERREAEDAERVRQQEEAKAEYARKIAEAQERKRAYEEEERRRKAEYEQYLKDNDLPF